MIDRYWYYWQQRHPEEQAGCGNCSVCKKLWSRLALVSQAGLHSFGGVVAEEYVGTIQKDENSPTGEYAGPFFFVLGPQILSIG